MNSILIFFCNLVLFFGCWQERVLYLFFVTKKEIGFQKSRLQISFPGKKINNITIKKATYITTSHENLLIYQINRGFDTVFILFSNNYLVIKPLSTRHYLQTTGTPKTEHHDLKHIKFSTGAR